MSEMIPIRILMGTDGCEARFGSPHRVDSSGDVNAGGCRGVQAFLGAPECSIQRGWCRSRSMFSARSASTPHFIVEHLDPPAGHEDRAASLRSNERQFAIPRVH